MSNPELGCHIEAALGRKEAIILRPQRGVGLDLQPGLGGLAQRLETFFPVFEDIAGNVGMDLENIALFAGGA